ncbi:hypothetical protein CSB90_3479 [Pseudomonas aeruginosa]|nr:hypothetical protein CSB90_3479 [Pseudomonas aeruginosa]
MKHILRKNREQLPEIIERILRPLKEILDSFKCALKKSVAV